MSTPSIYIVGGRVLSAAGAAIFATANSGQLPPGHWVPQQYSMVAVYPRPDGETNIWARHRNAYYDGVNSVQYAVPICIHGGSPPFIFSVTGPAGMTIGATYGSPNYGVVTWTPTGTVTGATVTVTATPQDGQPPLTITWTVSTSSSTSVFKFVSPTGNDSTGTGSISNPYQTVNKVLGNASSDVTGAGLIVYFRAGTYTPNAMSTSALLIALDNSKRPVILLGYPGESVTFTQTNTTYESVANASDLFWDNITFSGGPATTLDGRMLQILESTSARMTWFRCTFVNPVIGTDGTDNCTSWYTSGGGGSLRQYMAIHTCTETGRTASSNSYGMLSWFQTQYTCVENSTVNATASTNNFYLKDEAYDCTIRYCTSTGATDSGFACGGQTQTSFKTYSNVEFCYNYSDTLIKFNHENTTANNGSMAVYRNSINGAIQNVPTGGGAAGTYSIIGNAVQSASAIPSGTGITLSNNLQVASGLINSSGQLLAPYRAPNLGQVGNEVSA